MSLTRRHYLWMLLAAIPVAGLAACATQSRVNAGAVSGACCCCCDDPSCAPGCCPECPPDCKPTSTGKCCDDRSCCPA